MSERSAMGSSTITNATLSRGNNLGENLNGQGGAVYYGVWTTLAGAENIPGNVMWNFFITPVANPSPGDFLTPSASTSIVLAPGENTFYWWGEADDTLGGSDTFSLNLYFDGAATGSPGISGYTAAGPGQTLLANSSGHTGGFDGADVAGAGTLSLSDGGELVTLTDFQVFGVGFDVGPGISDLVGGQTVGANGTSDTFGSFTVFVTPEPSSLALLGAGSLVLSRRRKRFV